MFVILLVTFHLIFIDAHKKSVVSLLFVSLQANYKEVYNSLCRTTLPSFKSSSANNLY